MDERHRQVQCWLERVCGGDEVPAYEVTARTMGILYNMMQRNERGDQSTSIVTEDLQQKAEEYAAEGDHLKATLEKLGVTPAALSKSGEGSLNTIANVALLLETKDATDTSLLLGLNATAQEKLRVEDNRRTEQRLQSVLFNKTKEALVRLNDLEKSLESLDEQVKNQIPEINSKANQALFIQSKSRHYKKQANQLNIEVSKSGVDPSLYHRNLVTASQNLQDLKSKLQPMRAKLESYRDLPWDMSLAKVKLEEAKRDLASLDAELAKHIDAVHL